MDAYTLTIIVSVVLFVAIGNYSGRSVKRLDDYFVAGRNAPTLLIVGTLVASVFSTSIFMGEAGFTYDGQMGPYLLFPGLGVIGYVYGALLFGTYLRRSRATTVAEYFGQRFNSRRVQQAAGITIIAGLGGYLLVVTQGAAILLSDLTGIHYMAGLVTTWLSYTAFTMYAGSKGVILTDTLMFLLFTVATVGCVLIIVSDLGGIPTIITGLTQLDNKPDIAAWHGTVGPGTEWASPADYLLWMITIDIAWGVVYAVGPWQASRHLMARDEHVVIRASIYACFAVIAMQAMIYGTGGFINLANPDISPSETVIIWAAKNLVPTALGALLLAGIVAAALSSASTFLSLVGFSVSNDLFQREEPLTLNGTRLIMLVTGVVVLAANIAFPPNIFWMMLFIGTVFASSWGAVALMSVWNSRITADAAFWGLVCGFVFNVVPAALEYLGLIDWPTWFSPVIIGTLSSVLVILVMSWRGQVSAEESAFREKLHQPPASDCDAGKLSRTLIAPACLMVYGVFTPILLIRLYVIPYQQATGQLMADGGVNWLSGEALIALCSALVYIPLGYISYRVLKKRYRPPGKAVVA